MNNSPNQLANLDKGKFKRFKAGEKQGKSEAGRKGGIKSGQSRTISGYLKSWMAGKPNEKLKQRLEASGIENADSNGALIAAKLIEMCSHGDLKAIKIMMEQIGEDQKREAEIQKLKEEIAILKKTNEQMEAGAAATVEDLTSLASLLRNGNESGTND